MSVVLTGKNRNLQQRGLKKKRGRREAKGSKERERGGRAVRKKEGEAEPREVMVERADGDGYHKRCHSSLQVEVCIKKILHKIIDS